MITVAAACLNTTPLDWDGNQRLIRERVLLELLPDTAGLVVCIGLPRLHQRALFNTVAVVADGRIIGLVAKQHLAGDGIHYEPRWFKPWREGVIARTAIGPFEVPLGDLLFEIGGIRFGFEICEDAWVAERPGARLAAHGADLVLNPSASHFAFGKLGVRHRFVGEGSRAFGCAYVYANLLGNESGRAIYDGHALIASGGTIIAEGPRLAFAERTMVTATIDIAAARLAQARTGSFQPALTEHAGLVRAGHAWPEAPVRAAQPTGLRPWESSSTHKEEEFARAEALALFDYMRKSRAKGFVVSLSGGCDSTAVVALVGLMVRLALAELGPDGLRRRLAHIPGLPDDAAGVTARILTTVYQGTVNSSQVTRNAAREIAAAVGAKHLELDVGAFFDGYVAAVGKATGRTPDWQHDDIAMQNIQARVRAPGVWMITNVEDKLLLATSNRSEAAVGYTTMDGDTCGGLSPIAGIDKAFLRRWLEWMETAGPHGAGPLPALACVTKQRSTPELRPLAAQQQSEGDLMPFPVLDRIERLAIRDKLPPKDILPRLVAEFPAHDAPTLRGWIVRFTTLWCRNQWKRERFAPAFHLDDENLDPKTWCRFPILSGGFRRELGELP
jgi:NAD+ synthase (glutamine-hydrolysing)